MAGSKQVSGPDHGSVNPATEKSEAGTPVHPKGALPPGHTAVAWDGVGALHAPSASTTTGMTTSHPAFGGPKGKS